MSRVMCELYNIFDYLYNIQSHTAIYLWLKLKTIYYVTCNNSTCSDCCRSITLASKFFHPYGQKDQVNTEYSGGYTCRNLALECIRASRFIDEHKSIKLQSSSLQPADYCLIYFRKLLIYLKQFSVEPNLKILNMNLKRIFGALLTILGIVGMIYAAVLFAGNSAGTSGLKPLIIYGILGLIFFISGISLVRTTKDES